MGRPTERWSFTCTEESHWGPQGAAPQQSRPSRVHPFPRRKEGGEPAPPRPGPALNQQAWISGCDCLANRGGKHRWLELSQPPKGTLEQLQHPQGTRALCDRRPGLCECPQALRGREGIAEEEAGWGRILSHFGGPERGQED
jgi:hypothetical protein